MSVTRFVVKAVSLVIGVLGPVLVCGQDFPTKVIRIVTSGVGGGPDFVARLIAQGISGPLGQPVIVDNRGGGVNIAADIVAKAPPDGYTMLVAGTTFWIGPLLLQKAPYDPVKDFSAITMVSKEPNILVVHSSVPANSVKELIAYAKARPGALNFSTGGTGGTSHLAGELFKAMTGVNIVRISYKSQSVLTGELVAGQVQLTFGSWEQMMPQVKAGKLRALAVTSVEPSALLPGLPTVAATVPGFEAVSMTGLFVPAKTPASVINRLNQESVRFLKMAEPRERLLNIGSEAVGNSPEAAMAAVKSNMAVMGKVITEAGIKVE